MLSLPPPSSSVIARKGGFALVIALSLMAFILLLLLSITTLTRVEMRSAAGQKNRLNARTNAYTALQIALGELQLSTGPDTRITAPSTGMGEDGWVQVYRSDSASDPSVDAPMTSLLSQQTETNTDTVLLLTYGNENSSGTINPIEVSADTIKIEGQTTASIPSSNEMAWWIGDESLKASLPPTYVEPEDLVVTFPNLENRSQWLHGMAWGLPLNIFSTPSTDPTKISAISDSAAIKQYFEANGMTANPSTLTAQTIGVFSQTNGNGGLQFDLSTWAFDASEPDLSDSFIDLPLPISNKLREYIVSSREASDSNDSTFRESIEPNSTIHPILTELKLNYWVHVENNGSFASGGGMVSDRVTYQLHLFPNVEVTNPYSVAFDASRYRVVIDQLPGRDPSINNENYLKPGPLGSEWSNLESNGSEYFSVTVYPSENPDQTDPLWQESWRHTFYFDLNSDFHQSRDSDHPQLEILLDSKALRPGESALFSKRYQTDSRHDVTLQSWKNVGNSRIAFTDTSDSIASDSWSSIFRKPMDIDSNNYLPNDTIGIGYAYNERKNSGSIESEAQSLALNEYSVRFNFKSPISGSEPHKFRVRLYYVPDESGGGSTYPDISKDILIEERMVPIYAEPFQSEYSRLGMRTFGQDGRSSPNFVIGYQIADDTHSADWLNHTPDPRSGQASLTKNISGESGGGVPYGLNEALIEANTDPYLIISGIPSDSDQPQGVFGQAEGEEPHQRALLYDVPAWSPDNVANLRHVAFSNLSEEDLDLDSTGFLEGVSYAPAWSLTTAAGSVELDDHSDFDSQAQAAIRKLQNELWDKAFLSGYNGDPDDINISSRHTVLSPKETNTLSITTPKEIATELGRLGSFNINSINPEAWLTILSSAPLDALYVYDTSTENDPANPDDDEPSSSIEIAVENAGNPYLISSRIDTHPGLGYFDLLHTNNAPTRREWTTLRPVSLNELKTLSTEIAQRVQARGPFSSISSFIDSQILEDALIASNINTVTDPITPSLPSITPNQPRYLSPGSLLARIGTRLQARSDTFRIRAYGSYNGTKAWCEAIVQRTPEYIDATQAATELPTSGSINEIFGRRYQIVTFRWMNESDIQNERAYYVNN